MLNFSAATSVLVRKAFDHNLTGGAGVSHSGAEWGLGFYTKSECCFQALNSHNSS